MKKFDTMVAHSITGVTLTNARTSSVNTIQGHYHSLFGIEYFGDTNVLRWSMTVGTLMDTHSPAARYSEGRILKRPILGCGMIESEQDEYNIMIIPDMHLPYVHKDAFNFLWSVYCSYYPELIICVGDMFDHHSGSYHESEPDAMNPTEEYKAAKKQAKQLEEMFPEMVVIKGNHDEIPRRKLKSAGLPQEMLRDYNMIYDLKGGWEWVKRFKFNSGGGNPKLIPMRLKGNGRWNGKL